MPSASQILHIFWDVLVTTKPEIQMGDYEEILTVITGFKSAAGVSERGHID